MCTGFLPLKKSASFGAWSGQVKAGWGVGSLPQQIRLLLAGAGSAAPFLCTLTLFFRCFSSCQAMPGSSSVH